MVQLLYMKKIYLYIGIVVLLLTVFIVFLVKDPLINTNADKIKTETISCNGIEVTAPAPGSTVTFPLTIFGTIHPMGNIGTPRPWGVFEAEAGTVVVKNQDGEVISSPVLMSLTGDWMNTDPKPFSVIVPALTTIPDDSSVSIYFGDNNAEDGISRHTCEIPVNLLD